ncbi:dolichyl-phosphate-mannose--protein mannosyltransferase [Pseudanabaena sp. PCC 6802]|uniref:dolichyl-phosphate-mannose--protein mannosyltransferase n=1 Tax=Pseudanabaena sp. PCC 6802 TaxID=118173 RepID=UPI00034BC154|nr:phospholipid carrier-dependent glycosyltransferase [Pseudanabaena sp. PCC 6802]
MSIAQRCRTDPQFRFWLSVASMGLFSFLVRFWRLDAIGGLVFDEVYYPKFASDYLQGNPLFDAHPPLGKYIIALGIQIFGYNPFGYRCFSAIAGALIPLITCALAYQLGMGLGPQYLSPTTWALLAGWFTALDGLLLVESRLGLINIFIILFGMLSQVCFVLALKQQRCRWLRSIAAGIMLGASCSVKWNGLAYLLGMLAIAAIVGLRYGKRLKLWRLLLVIFIVVLVAVGTYLSIWIPHLQINPATNLERLRSLILEFPPIVQALILWFKGLYDLHVQIFNFHANLGANTSEPVHPYCSTWWGWPWMLRPIAYYFKTHADGTVTYINAMGNPILYWLGAIAILLCAFVLLYQLIRKLSRDRWTKNNFILNDFPTLIPVYLIASFAGHYLPWSLSRRCIFLYHYMPASVFAFMAIAYVTAWCSAQDIPILQQSGKFIVAAIALAFLFWSPIYLGLTIPIWYQSLLLWFPSWA